MSDDRLKVGVLYGGRSGEHDVSRCSAASIVSSLDESKYHIVAVGIDRDGKWYPQDTPEIVDDRDFGRILKLTRQGEWFMNNYPDDGRLTLFDIKSNRRVTLDVIFPAVHGTFCEDGTLQGMLELSAVPYVGADVIGSAVGMDKDVAKRLLKESGLPVTPWITVQKHEWQANPGSISSSAFELGLPLFVKPANAGSSVGVKRVAEKGDLSEAITYSFLYDTKILIEKGIECREVECAVLGNSTPEASVLGEIIPGHEFYSYEAKYIDPDGAELKIPAEFDDSLSDTMRNTAVKAYRALCCTGMARVDIFLEKNGNTYYINEINTIPGFTTISMYPKLWDYTGVTYSQLLERLIELALDRHKEKQKIRTEL